MKTCKLIISGVPIQQKQELDSLAEEVAAVSHEEMAKNINNSLFLRLALNDFLNRYRARSNELAQRLKINIGE